MNKTHAFKCNDILLDNENIIYIGSTDNTTGAIGLTSFDGLDWRQTFKDNSAITDNTIGGLAYNKATGAMWLAGSQGGGAVRIQGTDTTTFLDTMCVNQTLNDTLCIGGNTIKGVTFDGDGNVWFAVAGWGLSKYNGFGFTHYRDTFMGGPLVTNQIRNVIYDSINNVLWLTTEGAIGIIKYDFSTFTHYSTGNSGLPGDNVFNVTTDQSGTVYTSHGISFSVGLGRYMSGTWDHLPNTNVGFSTYGTAYIDKTDTLWYTYNIFAPASNGVVKYSDGVFDTVGTLADMGLDPSSTVFAVNEDNQGNLMFATNKGFLLYNPGGIVFNISFNNVTHVDCFGDSTGSATVYERFGHGSYTYLWNDASAQTTQTASNLPAGTYTVTVTDVDSPYAATDMVTITEPASALSVTGTGSMDATTFGASDGWVSVSANGGTPPYSYMWSDTIGNNTLGGDTFQNQPAGVYTVTITDDNGCTTTATDTIDQPVGVYELELGINKFNLFPNPFNDKTNIQLGFAGNTSYAIRLYDMKGSEVMTIVEQANPISGTQNYELSSKDLNAGIYYLTLTTKEGSITKKLVVFK